MQDAGVQYITKSTKTKMAERHMRAMDGGDRACAASSAVHEQAEEQEVDL